MKYRKLPKCYYDIKDHNIFYYDLNYPLGIFYGIEINFVNNPYIMISFKDHIYYEGYLNDFNGSIDNIKNEEVRLQIKFDKSLINYNSPDLNGHVIYLVY